LLAALITAASRLVATQWTGHLKLIQTLTFLGVLAGLALGQSIFSSRQATAFALLYGLFAVPWQLGLTLGHSILWAERLASLADCLTISISRLARHRGVLDPMFFLFLMSSLFWVLSVHAGYTLTRHARPWRATLPAGLTTLIIHISDPFVAHRAWFLAAYLLFTLLLLVRLTYLRHRTRWQQSHIPLPFIGFDLTLAHLLVTALLVLAAWTIPVLATVLPSAEQAWERATQPWTAIRDRLDDAFASLRSTGSLVSYYNYYSEHLPLGRGSELADTLILTVETSPDPDESVRYYWRARIYDHYADNLWSSTFPITRSITPSYSGLTFPDLESRQMVTLTVTPAIPIATLYTAPQPLWVSCPAQADLAYNPDGTTDLSALHATPPLYTGETYQARSSLSTVTIAQLRAAGTDYPTWVTDRYLQVPSTVTTRTLELARQIAADLDSPYDIAARVTSYLRIYIRYIETVPSPPPDQEPLDWFLFDLRQGFCNYYASTEVILLRSLGIPARLAIGFAQGERQAQSNTYLVHQHDAHAWPEVYFPDLGWIEFEPTASQPPIHRPLGEDQPYTSSVGGPERPWHDLEEFPGFEPYPLDETFPAATPDSSPKSRMTAVSWTLFLVLGLILTTLAWRTSRQRGLPPLPILLEGGLRRLGLKPPATLRRWTLHATLSPLARAYLELNQALARLGAPADPADTPAERAAALTRLLPAAADPAQQLLAEYHAANYSPRSGNLHIAQQAARAIRDLSWRARARRLINRQWEPTASSYTD
jgi:transglutaminase-like putative cysteine protease